MKNETMTEDGGRRTAEQAGREAAASRERSNAAVALRAVITRIQIMGMILSETLKDGQKAEHQLPVVGADQAFVEKLRSQLLHTNSLIANAQLALPAIPEIQRHVARLTEFPSERITGEFGASVRTNEHGANQRQKSVAA